MRRSRFEVQIGILNALAQYEPLKPTHIMYNAHLNFNALKQVLKPLITNGLVKGQKLGKKRKLYSITEKGQRVLEYTRKIDNSLPVMETIRI